MNQQAAGQSDCMSLGLTSYLPSNVAWGRWCGNGCEGASPGGGAAGCADGIGAPLLSAGDNWCDAEPTAALLITGSDDCQHTLHLKPTSHCIMLHS